MTGPEHYREAMTMINAASSADFRIQAGVPRKNDTAAVDYYMKLAQFHATMAAAAASALIAIGQHATATQLTDDECADWVDALGL